MAFKSYRLVVKILLGLLAGVAIVLTIRFHAVIWQTAVDGYHLLSDRQQVRAFISSFGMGAPLVFMGIQVLQVIFAPIPGEATGFIGGYLFGTLKGFLYSSTALAIGSWINFSIGRFFGEHFVRRLIPADKFEKFDGLLKRQGIIVLFVLFVFPGFPKDYLCLILGLSTLPLKLFLLIAGVGRMPGTLLLSLQGEFLFEQNYIILAVAAGLCAIAAFLAIRYRQSIYRWVERFNHQQ